MSEAVDTGMEPGQRRFGRLPDSVRLEDTVTSQEMRPYEERRDEYWREVEWMLKVTGGG